MANVSSSNGLEKHPKLRFKGFSEPWTSISFGELFTYLPNNTLSRAELNYESGEYQNVHYGDVLIKYGPVLDATTDGLPFITEYNDKNAHKQLLQSGDVIIADTAEDEAVGKATEIINVGKRKVVSGLHTIACRPRVEMAPTYLGFYINSETYHQQLYSLMQGVKVLSISKSNIEGTTLCYPTEAEQQKICDLLNLIELRIVKQRQLIEHLKKYKRGVSIAVFDRKLSLAKNSPSWIKTTVGEICKITMGQSPDSESYNTDQIGIPLVQGNADMKNRITYPQRYTNKPTKVCDEGSIILSVRAPVGSVGRADRKVCLGRGVCAINADNNDFLYYFFERYEPYWKRIEQGGTFTAISGDDIADMPIDYPSFDERRLIANFLKKIDNHITAEENALNQLVTMKNGILQQMFI